MSFKIITVFSALMLLFFVSCTTAGGKTASAAQSSGFELNLDTASGGSFSFAENIKGKKHLFISFWATWCDPCKSELFKLRDIYSKYKDKIEFVAVATDTEESIDKVKSFAVENSFPFPILIDPQKNTVSSMIPGGDTVPYSILVDKNGNIISKHSGFEPGDEQNLMKEFDNLIGKQP